jgi:hypothetical protein
MHHSFRSKAFKKKLKSVALFLKMGRWNLRTVGLQKSIFITAEEMKACYVGWPRPNSKTQTFLLTRTCRRNSTTVSSSGVHVRRSELLGVQGEDVAASHLIRKSTHHGRVATSSGWRHKQWKSKTKCFLCSELPFIITVEVTSGSLL